MPTSPVASAFLLAGLVFAIAAAPLAFVIAVTMTGVIFEVGVFLATGRTDEDGVGA